MADIKFGPVKLAAGKLSKVAPTPDGVRLVYELVGKPSATVNLTEAEVKEHIRLFQEALATRAKMKA